MRTKLANVWILLTSLLHDAEHLWFVTFPSSRRLTRDTDLIYSVVINYTESYLSDRSRRDLLSARLVSILTPSVDNARRNERIGDYFVEITFRWGEFSMQLSLRRYYIIVARMISLRFIYYELTSMWKMENLSTFVFFRENERIFNFCLIPLEKVLLTFYNYEDVCQVDMKLEIFQIYVILKSFWKIEDCSLFVVESGNLCPNFVRKISKIFLFYIYIYIFIFIHFIFILLIFIFIFISIFIFIFIFISISVFIFIFTFILFIFIFIFMFIFIYISLKKKRKKYNKYTKL